VELNRKPGQPGDDPRGKRSGNAVYRRLDEYKFEPMDLANVRQDGVWSIEVIATVTGTS
jgi:hypothetical protein